jgi:predicted solute-binding protein
VVHQNAPSPLKTLLRQWLQQFSTQETRLIEESVPDVASRLDVPQDYVRRYLKVIRRCLTAEDDAGQAKFMEELKRQGEGLMFKQEG